MHALIMSNDKFTTVMSSHPNDMIKSTLALGPILSPRDQKTQNFDNYKQSNDFCL
jgi:hypothetical protein